MTESEKRALLWLAEHNGDGAFAGRGRTLVAAGEVAPFYRRTFNNLRDLGLAEMYGEKRIRLTELGYTTAKTVKLRRH